MWPDRVSNPGPLALESDVLPTVLCGPAVSCLKRAKQPFCMSLLNSGPQHVFIEKE